MSGLPPLSRSQHWGYVLVAETNEVLRCSWLDTSVEPFRYVCPDGAVARAELPADVVATLVRGDRVVRL